MNHVQIATAILNGSNREILKSLIDCYYNNSQFESFHTTINRVFYEIEYFQRNELNKCSYKRKDKKRVIRWFKRLNRVNPYKKYYSDFYECYVNGFPK